uniref:Uncharacterized protein n=1 Tax=Salix viminalis TaxID=40686 RepID=A0A6N2NFG7_SALVM
MRTIEEISSAENCFSSSLWVTTIIGLSPGPGMTLNGQSLISLWTEESVSIPIAGPSPFPDIVTRSKNSAA